MTTDPAVPRVDLRARLTEALDANQRELDARDGARVVPLKFRGEWRGVDRPLADALIERDRALVDRHKPELSGSGKPGLWCAGCASNYEHVAECPELLAAAAFWLGTQEADRG